MCQSKSVGGVCVPTSWKQQKCSPPLLVFQKGFTRLGLWSAVAHHFLRLFQFSKLEQFFKIKRKKQQKKSLKSPAARQHSSMTAITWRIGSNKSIMVNESRAKYPQFNCFSNFLCDSFQLFFFLITWRAVAVWSAVTRLSSRERRSSFKDWTDSFDLCGGSFSHSASILAPDETL